jgi:aryl-alcohol dehydrogenase-like predicted oxidoreductase
MYLGTLRRYFDAARSYGRAEEFLGGWLAARGIAPQEVVVGSKWGYVYTANWQGRVLLQARSGRLRHC